jgi:hypothetical protein
MYDYFVDKTNSKTGKQLFSKVAKDMPSNMIKVLYLGELSDPHGTSWYTLQMTMTDGKSKIDKYGLHLWHSFLGTVYKKVSQGQDFSSSDASCAPPMLFNISGPLSMTGMDSLSFSPYY